MLIINSLVSKCYSWNCWWKLLTFWLFDSWPITRSGGSTTPEWTAWLGRLTLHRWLAVAWTRQSLSGVWRFPASTLSSKVSLFRSREHPCVTCVPHVAYSFPGLYVIILRKLGQVSQLTLTLLSQSWYDTQHLPLNKDMIIYTDGLISSMNPYQSHENLQPVQSKCIMII